MRQPEQNPRNERIAVQRTISHRPKVQLGKTRHDSIIASGVPDATDEVSDVVHATDEEDRHAVGRPAAFIVAISLVVLWGISGPLFGFSDTWQLVINTATTVVTFLMVFLIQSTQNRDAEAMQVKLDEIIRAIGNANNQLLDLEELEEQDLDRIRSSYEELARKARGERKGRD
jgi:low affinity Fe/Cu permease